VYVGICKLALVLGQSQSLKEKRMVIRRIKDRVRDRIGVVVNEVGELDSWQRAELGCAVTSADRVKALDLIDQVVRVVQSASSGQVVGIAKDAWTFDEPTGALADTQVDDRTGSGDKAAASDDWIPDEWKTTDE